VDISFGPEILGDFASCSEREWLETNGIGGFASSTLAGAHTRRYHGLLVAALTPPVSRTVMVSNIDETVRCEDHVYELGCNQYMGEVYPRGYRHLVSFHLAPCPTWVFQCGQVELKKSVLMPLGETTTIVTYELLNAPAPVTLKLGVLVACRDHGVLARETPGARLGAEDADGRLTIQPYESVPPVHVAYPAGARWVPKPRWVRNVEHHWELARGLDFQEDLIKPGSLEISLVPGARISIVLSMKARRASDADELIERELARRVSLTTASGDYLVSWLRRAADQFMVRRADGGESMIAGYHWFCDWGRDTMIALPGLALVLGRHTMAREVLETFSRYEKDGLLPNRFPDQGQAPVYNTVDAALWYAYTAEKYLKTTGDTLFARHVLYPTLQRIIDGYRKGTHFNIRMDEDGLITQGQKGYALTWMDAKMGDWVVTPRTGKPVEVNALWYNALGFAADLADSLGTGDGEPYRALAARVRESFSAFWNSEGGYLHDLLTPDGPDPAVRPNQVFALSLPRTLLGPGRARSVLAVVERELLTPLGLRSLSPTHPGFMARYEGDLARRDGAYHQGAVWSYLIGHYLTAFFNVHGRTPETQARVRRMLKPFRDHLLDAGLGSISEIFDGDSPHRPAGCISQAWSVGELLRVIFEELGGVADPDPDAR
jgi:predicted glycogen debranching enzyme